MNALHPYKFDIFYLYIDGTNFHQGKPPKFSKPGWLNRTCSHTKVGDLVFGVVPQNSKDKNIAGRVLKAWQISHIKAHTDDLGIYATNERDTSAGGTYRWPNVLLPIRTWLIRDPRKFKELSGYPHDNTKLLDARNWVADVNPSLAKSLLNSLKKHGHNLNVIEPANDTGPARKLAELRENHSSPI